MLIRKYIALKGHAMEKKLLTSCYKGNFPALLIYGSDTNTLLIEARKEISDKLMCDIDSSSDFHIVSPVSNSISVTQIRDLNYYISETPTTIRGKFAIIYEADRMTENASNACLKILEDAPKNVQIFLVTSKPYKLPMTLRSRCIKIRHNMSAKRLDYTHIISSVASDPLSMIGNLELEFENIFDCLMLLINKLYKYSVKYDEIQELSSPEMFLYNKTSDKDYIELFERLNQLKTVTLNKHLDKTQNYLLAISEIL